MYALFIHIEKQHIAFCHMNHKMELLQNQVLLQQNELAQKFYLEQFLERYPWFLTLHLSNNYMFPEP